VILEKSFRARIAQFYNEFRKNKNNPDQPMSISLASDLILLLKYLAGKLPVSDFEFDFEKKGTALNMLETLFERMGESINRMSRPVDAIKHQAKTVTVGTSRISEKVEGLLFDALSAEGFSVAQLLNRNVMVMKNLQPVVRRINGSILYRIGNLDPLGEPGKASTIEVLRKRGILAEMPSRVETDHILKGTKKIIVARSNVYIGKGRKDGRSILVIPILSTSPATPNHIEHLLLLNIAIKDTLPVDVRVRALGGKYDHVVNLVQESRESWDDRLLDRISNEDLFGMSAEKVAEAIVANGRECRC
jgi:glucosamine--fructose-6-phosphate aminotransferase (isomerizing)